MQSAPKEARRQRVTCGGHQITSEIEISSGAAVGAAVGAATGAAAGAAAGAASAAAGAAAGAPAGPAAGGAAVRDTAAVAVASTGALTGAARSAAEAPARLSAARLSLLRYSGTRALSKVRRGGALKEAKRRAASRCARAYLLRLRLLLRHLPDAVKATPGYADVGASAIGDAVHEDHDNAARRRSGESDERAQVVCREVHRCVFNRLHFSAWRHRRRAKKKMFAYYKR